MKRRSGPRGGAPRVECTLLELVCAVNEVSADEQETVATLRHLVRSGRVRLIGALRDETLADEA